MQINSSGHVVNSEGITTRPHASPYWLGNENHRVAFDYLVLDNGSIALHAIYGNVLREYHSEFFYDVIDNSKTLASAKNLIGASLLLLKAHSPDTDFDTDNVDEFLNDLANEIIDKKRAAFYIVPKD